MDTAGGTAGSEVGRQIAAIVEAVRARDLAALRALYAPDVVSFDVEPPLRHLGVEAKLKNWERVFTVFREPDYEVRDLVVSADGDVAFGYCLARLHGTLATGTRTEGMWVRATFCFRRLDGAWRIVHDQASVPFDPVHRRAVPDLEP